MEIKKIIYASCTCMMALSVCGCQKNKEIIKEEPVVKEVVKLDKEEEKKEEVQEEVITWDSVSSDYNKICNSVSFDIEMNPDTFLGIVGSMKNDFNALKEINPKNEWRAKSLFRNACTLSLYVTYSEAPINTSVINLSEIILTLACLNIKNISNLKKQFH